MANEIQTAADAGFVLLSAHRTGITTLTRRSAQFCGQLMASGEPLTDAQADWLDKLLAKAGISAQFSKDAI